jgi:hypothetical protein
LNNGRGSASDVSNQPNQAAGDCPAESDAETDHDPAAAGHEQQVAHESQEVEGVFHVDMLPVAPDGTL